VAISTKTKVLDGTISTAFGQNLSAHDHRHLQWQCGFRDKLSRAYAKRAITDLRAGRPRA
jgi:hypothetical protein